ncbi:hypothetical protein TWF694_007685 [Orbilia ellipsospora]|uniref:Rhodopsin domain-containing protein n=1 Tax=Orbilia ellipsospora TaxID=2528407 RepID=A0AAV9XIY2_9PEZI
MSSDSGTYAAPSQAETDAVNANPLFQHDIMQTLGTVLWLGPTSPKLSNLTGLQVIDAYAQYSFAVNGSLTPEGLNDLFGVTPENAAFLFTIFGGPQTLAYTTYAIAQQIQPYLEHPETPVVVVPLFIAFTIFTTFVMALRLWSRYKLAGGIQPFDWLAFAGYLMTVAWGALAVHHDHATTNLVSYYDRTWDSISECLRTYTALAMLYPWVMMTIKFSLLLFYYRMTNWNYIRWSVYVTAAVVGLNTLVAFILWIVQCPHLSSWDHPSETCRIDNVKQQVAIASIYIATDIIIWILPMPLVFQLQLYLRERILAIFTFSLGAIACIASCLRLRYLLKFGLYSTQSSTTLLIDAWTIVELNLALICASAPAVRALAIHYAPKIRSSLGSKPYSSKASAGSDHSSSGSSKSGARAKVSDVEKV